MYPSRRSKLPLDQFIAMSNSVFIEKKNSTHRKAIVNDNSHGVRIGGEDGSNHHQIDEHASEVSQRSGWLRHDHNGVHHCVHHAASGKQTEVEHSAGYGRAGPNVDQADEEEWHDVFHIVEMRPAIEALMRLIMRGGSIGYRLKILWKNMHAIFTYSMKWLHLNHSSIFSLGSPLNIS